MHPPFSRSALDPDKEAGTIFPSVSGADAIAAAEWAMTALIQALEKARQRAAVETRITTTEARKAQARSTLNYGQVNTMKDHKLKNRVIETNGIKIQLAERGEGPLVVLCHGFPELWYSWRHQLTALAEAGYHAVAPDQRGYGQTDRPEAIEDYHVFELTADVVGLV